MMAKKPYSEVSPFSGHYISDEKRMSFSKKEYSWFKYGSRTIARKFGYDLANEFFKSKQFLELITKFKKKQIVVCSSPYQFIPTATFAMKDYFIQKFNEKLVEFGLDPVEECKINRICSYDTDYGSMSAEERHVKITGDGFHIDKELVKDKFVIFLDDIKITGAHERRIAKLIADYNLECDYMFMYYAESHVEGRPEIEDFLNLYAIKNLLDINYIIRNQEFILNTRVTKYILKASKEEFENFINYQSESFRETLYRNAIGNKYHKSDKFAENLKYLQKNI
jgi:hypothetical protein